MGVKQFAVLGDPVEHSLSPIIHQAAYAALGLDWQYSRIQMSEEGLALFLEEQAHHFAGFSLTMPLKEELFKLAVEFGWHIESDALSLRSANTLVLDASGQKTVANTDLAGAKLTIGDLPASIESAAILGSGATARTLALAIAHKFSNLRELTVFSRRSEPAIMISALLDDTGVQVKFEWLPLEAAADFGGADFTVNTLPTSVSKNIEVDLPFTESFVLDVTYDNYGGSPALRWPLHNRLDGRSMLVFQAVQQLKLFGAFDEGDPAVTEAEVTKQMFAAL
jgi:shikimate dehydrogenase